MPDTGGVVVITMRLFIIFLTSFLLQNCNYTNEQAYTSDVKLIPSSIAVNYLNETRIRVENGEIGEKAWGSRTGCKFDNNKITSKKGKKLTYKQSRFTTWTALTFLYLDIYQGSKIFCEFIFYGRNSKEFDKFVSALISLDAHYSDGVY